MKKKLEVFPRINVTAIIRNHLASLKNVNTGKSEFSDFILFLFLPILMAGTLIFFKVTLTEGMINILITSLSIFIGLFFNVLVLIIGTLVKNATENLEKKILQELIDNVSYTIIISMLSILFGIFSIGFKGIMGSVFNGVTFFILFHFLMTVLLVLKRIYLLFTHQLNKTH